MPSSPPAIKSKPRKTTNRASLPDAFIPRPLPVTDPEGEGGDREKRDNATEKDVKKFAINIRNKAYRTFRLHSINGVFITDKANDHIAVQQTAKPIGEYTDPSKINLSPRCAASKIFTYWCQKNTPDEINMEYLIAIKETTRSSKQRNKIFYYVVKRIDFVNEYHVTVNKETGEKKTSPLNTVTN